MTPLRRRRSPLLRWLKPAAISVAAAGLVALVAWRVVAVSAAELESRGVHAASSLDAEERGILRARPAVPARDFEYEGRHLHIRDAWIEQVTRTEYWLYLWPRQVRDSAYRLVLLADPAAGPGRFDCDEWLTAGDSAALSSGGDDFVHPVHPPFPDTVRLRVVQRSARCLPHVTTDAARDSSWLTKELPR